MSLQVHGIVENTNDLDPHLSFDMEEDKVTSTIPLTGGMQGMQALGDVGRGLAPAMEGPSRRLAMALRKMPL